MVTQPAAAFKVSGSNPGQPTSGRVGKVADRELNRRSVLQRPVAFPFDWILFSPLPCTAFYRLLLIKFFDPPQKELLSSFRG